MFCFGIGITVFRGQEAEGVRVKKQRDKTSENVGRVGSGELQDGGVGGSGGTRAL
jgi:hypothetical protein